MSDSFWAKLCDWYHLRAYFHVQKHLLDHLSKMVHSHIRIEQDRHQEAESELRDLRHRIDLLERKLRLSQKTSKESDYFVKPTKPKDPHRKKKRRSQC